MTRSPLRAVKLGMLWRTVSFMLLLTMMLRTRCVTPSPCTICSPTMGSCMFWTMRRRIWQGPCLAIRWLFGSCRRFAHSARTKTAKKLLERCFSDPIGVNFHTQFKDFHGHVYLKRWGSVAFSTPQVKSVEAALRYGWNLASFSDGSKEKAAEGHDEFFGHDVPEVFKGASESEICDLAIKGSTWWAYVAMLEFLAKMLRQLRHCAEWCPCHAEPARVAESLPDNLRKELLSVWERCPFRGCRAVELATGEFMDMVSFLWELACGGFVVARRSHQTSLL